MGFGLDNQPCPACGVALGNGVDILLTFGACPVTVDNPAGRKIWPVDETHKFLHADVIDPRVVVDHMDAGVDDFGQVVGRDAGGHTHGDAAGAVDEQIGQGRGQHRRFAQGAVEVFGPVDGILFQIAQDQITDSGEAGFGVAHGRRVVAVNGAKVALAVHQGIAHTEVLGQTYHRIVDSRVAVGMILAQHFADDTRALFVGGVGVQAQIVHGIEDTAMDRF